MANAFLAYWKPETADFNLERGNPLDHAASEQFGRVESDDHVWIVTVRSGELSVLGCITVGHVVDRDQAAKLLGRDDLWKASHHIVAAHGTAEPLREVRIPGLAETLRFESPSDRLSVDSDLVSAQQLQTMRVLTPGSAAELEAAFRRAV